VKAERTLRRITPGVTVAMAVVLVGAGACSSSSGKQTSGSAKQTISISVQGLGTETDTTKKQIKEFEAANPNITVNTVALSPDANTLN
jgi:ABC-type glycerol-3-phosphate transport system substrate-binding protein